jgi:hypothetical protein
MSEPNLDDGLKKVLSEAEYITPDVRKALAQATGANFSAIEVKSNSTYHEGKLMLSILSKIPHPVAQGAALQASIMGFTAAGTYKGTFYIGENEYDMEQVKSTLGISKLTQNSPPDALSWGRLCRVFAGDTMAYLLEKENVMPKMFTKVGRKLGMDRHKCFVGAENIINAGSDQAKKFIMVQTFTDAARVKTGHQKAGDFEFENGMINFFMAKGMEPMQAKGVPKKKKAPKEANAAESED